VSKHTFSSKALTLFAGVCLLVLSGCGTQSRAAPSAPTPSAPVVCDGKVDCDSIQEKEPRTQQQNQRGAQVDYDRQKKYEERRKRTEDRMRAYEEKYPEMRQRREARQRAREEEQQRRNSPEAIAQREAEKREFEERAAAFRRQIKIGDYVASVSIGFLGYSDSCNGMVVSVSPPLVEVEWREENFGTFFFGTTSTNRRTEHINGLYPCSHWSPTKK